METGTEVSKWLDCRVKKKKTGPSTGPSTGLGRERFRPSVGQVPRMSVLNSSRWQFYTKPQGFQYVAHQDLAINGLYL